jgi:hypothetical protein
MALAIGPTVGGAWITTGTIGVVGVVTAELNSCEAAMVCMAANRIVGAPEAVGSVVVGSGIGTSWGSTLTRAATGPFCTGVVVGSLGVGAAVGSVAVGELSGWLTVVLCCSTVADVVGSSTTGASSGAERIWTTASVFGVCERTAVGPRGSAVGSDEDGAVTSGVTGVDTSVTSAVAVAGGSDTASLTVVLVLG